MECIFLWLERLALTMNSLSSSSSIAKWAIVSLLHQFPSFLYNSFLFLHWYMGFDIECLDSFTQTRCNRLPPVKIVHSCLRLRGTLLSIESLEITVSCHPLPLYLKSLSVRLPFLYCHYRHYACLSCHGTCIYYVLNPL